MKIKIKDLLERRIALDKVLASSLPFKLSYRLNKIAAAFMSEMNCIEKTRAEMIKTFGTEKENGDYKIEDVKQTKKFQEAWGKFIEDDIEFNIQKIPLDVLEDGRVLLSAYDIANLELFMEGEPLKKKKKDKHTSTGTD